VSCWKSILVIRRTSAAIPDVHQRLLLAGSTGDEPVLGSSEADHCNRLVLADCWCSSQPAQERVSSTLPMSIEPKVYPDPEVDREAVIVRGACGALLGVFVAVGIWMRYRGVGPVGSVALFAGSIAVCCVGSIRHGDAFWYALLRRRR
jgi:hypothetical protein